MTSVPAAGSVAVCVYCASGPVSTADIELATAVGSAIAARGWTLVSGGGRVSMMGAVARAARQGGARTIGVIPRALVEREVADVDADELLVVDSMRERKGLMDVHSTAFLALPGGIGTCEELFEVWTSRYIGMHVKPVVVLDPDDHYQGMLEWVRGLVDKGFASRQAVDVLRVTKEVGAALDACLP